MNSGRHCHNCRQILIEIDGSWHHDSTRRDPARRSCMNTPIPCDPPSSEVVKAQRNCKRHLMACICRPFPDGCGCGNEPWAHTYATKQPQFWDGEKIVTV